MNDWRTLLDASHQALRTVPVGVGETGGDGTQCLVGCIEQGAPVVHGGLRRVERNDLFR